jgi:hypothetical protein
MAALTKFGGEFIVRCKPVEVLMGTWDPRKDLYALGVAKP